MMTPGQRRLESQAARDTFTQWDELELVRELEGGGWFDDVEEDEEEEAEA